jgi:hypothetical protein
MGQSRLPDHRQTELAMASDHEHASARSARTSMIATGKERWSNIEDLPAEWLASYGQDNDPKLERTRLLCA